MTVAMPRPPLSRNALVALAVPAGSVVYYIARYMLRYAVWDESHYGVMWSRRLSLLPHVIGGVTAATVGVIQLVTGESGRTTRAHRTLGWIYTTGVALGAAGSLSLSITVDPWEFGYATGLFALGVVWPIATAMAIIAAKRRAFAQHREWMIRSYVLTFAFVVFRFTMRRIIALKLGTDADVDGFLAWSCWAVPLFITELMFGIGRLRRAVAR